MKVQKEVNDMLIKIKEFIRTSMLVKDGIELVGHDTINYKSKEIKGLIFKINDLDRGEFFIGWYK